MKQKSLLIGLVALVLVGVLSACSTPTTDKTNTRQMTVAGTGKVYLTPDVSYIVIGVRSEADTVADALGKNNTQSTAVAAKLKELGVAEKDVQTSAFNVYPQQEFDRDGKPIRSFYVVENTVNVTVRDLKKLGEILDAVVRNGANTINGISFDVENKASAITEARRLAIEDARKQADEMATAAGVKLGSVMNLSVYQNGNPTPMYDAKGMGAANATGGGAQVPIAAGQLVIFMQSSITYELK
jgi:uncharacterized protein YggE